MTRAVPGAPPGGGVPDPVAGMDDGGDAGANLRGATVIVVSMACFAVEDALIKLIGASVPPAQIVWMLGLGGAACIAGWLAASGARFLPAGSWHPMVVWRTGFEVAATLCFVPALVLIPLSTATAILQAAPLVVAGGAALVFGAVVGPRRWAAIGAGFAGVLLIVRPGTAFEPATLLAIAGTLALGARDLTTRRVPPGITSVRLSLIAYLALVPTAMALQLALGQPVVPLGAADTLRMAGCIGIGLVGYVSVSVVAALRIGDVAVVSSFRYARMVFALILALIVFRERPDAPPVLGIAIIVSAGLYTLVREARLARALPCADGAR